jgi:hypothetical protein
LPTDPVCDFPNLRIASDDHVIKRIEASIESFSGEFYGIVRKSSDLPDGFGVFVASDGWIHCGQVKDSLFQEGRIVSANKEAKILKLIFKKLQIDGNVLEKIEIFSHSGAQCDFLKNGQKIADIIARLNLFKDPQNWLSIQPNPLSYSILDMYLLKLGELSEFNRLHGRGIEIENDGVIWIGYFEKGR